MQVFKKSNFFDPSKLGTPPKLEALMVLTLEVWFTDLVLDIGFRFAGAAERTREVV